MKMRFLAVALLSASVASPVLADARADVMQAYEKAMAQDAYRVQMTSEHRGQSTKTTVDVQPPDRFHMRSPETEVIVLPGATWMNNAGQWMKLPMDMSSMIRGMTLTAMRDGANAMQDVQRIGSEAVNGCESTAYSYRAQGEAMGIKAEADVTMWVCDATGLPVRMISSDTKSKTRTVLDYDYESAIDIRPPN